MGEGSSVAVSSCGVDLAAAALIRTLVGELPYAVSGALKSKKKKVAATPHGYEILCLLIWQATFYFSI